MHFQGEKKINNINKTTRKNNINEGGMKQQHNDF